MASGSNITVQSGGKLYVWGYIQGDGTVTLKKGAIAYENYTSMDFTHDVGRALSIYGGNGGGNMLSIIYNNLNGGGAFPLRAYVINNTEVPMTMEYGSTLKIFYHLWGPAAGYFPGFATYIGATDGDIFEMKEGCTLIRSYENGRAKLDIRGSTDVNPIQIDFTIMGITINMSSGNTSGMTFASCYDAHFSNNGTVTFYDDFILTEGSTITIDEGYTVNTNGHNLYLLGQEDDKGAHTGKDVYGTAYTIVDKDALVDNNGTAIVNGGFYTTAGKASFTSSKGTGTIQFTGSNDKIGSTIPVKNGYNEVQDIALDGAVLQHADGTYTEAIPKGNYTYADGKWVCENHTGVEIDHNCDVCGFITDCVDANDHNCDVCGKTLSECADGEDADFNCDVCGKNLCKHEGEKTATGEKAATCEADGNSAYWQCNVCEVYFSDAEGKTEIAENAWVIEALGHTASGTWLTNEDNTKHYQACKTCGEVAIEGTHSGGTATCMTPATCDVCKQSYDSVDSNNHNFSAEWSTDENGHWKVCLNGCSVKGSAGNHTGGTANCVDQAVCETCQTAYGNVDGGNHKTVKTDAAQAPDCTNTGLTEGSHCEACNTVIVAQTTVNALGHEAGAEATCTTAQTCIRCTYVYEAALGHSYTNYVSNEDARCEVDGTETAQCGRCNETHTRTDEGSALGHSYTNYVVNNNATCQSNGTETATCDNGCGGTESRTIENSTVGHSYGEYVSDNNATCLNNGTQTAKCIWCEATVTVTVEDSALGHNWGEYISDGNATCLNNGTMTRTCGRCELTETVTETDSALGHSFTDYVPNDDAVCGKDGTKTATCDRCDATDTVTNEGSALVHQFTNYTYNNDAKCGVDGTKTAECDHGCGATDTIPAEGTALTHSYTNYVSNGDATCTQDGTKSAYCVHGCGTKDTVADEGSALGHNFTNYVSNNNATCTANGTETGTCSRCDATDIREIPNSILPHSYTNYTSNGDASCTADGTKTAKCDYCTSTTTVTDAGSMLEHSYGDWIVETPATCTAEGSSHRECSSCDAFETRVDAATNHSMGDWYISNPATCKISGEKRRDCAVCEYYETEVIEALSHNYTSAVTKQPTCVDKGVETFTCSNCQNSYTQEIAATGVHTEATREENRMEATCGVNGSYNLVTYCSVCTQVLKTEAKVIPATGAHNYESKVTVEPTCIAVGERTYTCTVCQDSYTEEIEKAPHTVSQEYTTENGKHYHKCTTEGCTYVEEEAECSGGKATCKDLAVCEICGKAYGELAPENHVGGTTIKDASAATCTTPGYTGDTYCLGCDTKIADGESISTASHHYSSSVTKEATCVEAGVRTYTCYGCGSSYTEEIPATGNHDWKAATYTAPKTCSECGEIEGEPLVDVENPENIPAEDIEEALDAMVKVTDAIQPEDSGMEADTNKETVEAAKADVKDENGNAVTGNSYETSLVITLNAVVVDKDGDELVAKKVTFDVSPMLYALDAIGTKVGQTKITSFETEITFRLPVDGNAKATKAKVWHEKTLMGEYAILGDAETGFYVEVQSKTFSEFTVIIENECKLHNFVDGVCTECGQVETIRHYGQNLRLQDLIKIGYYFYLNTDENVEEVGALLWTAEQFAQETNYNVNSTLAKNYQNLTPATGIYYIVETDGIYAQNLDDTFVLIPYYVTSNGNAVYGSAIEYSPLHYAKKALEEGSKASENTKLLVKDLLNYGTAARTYFCVKEGLALLDTPFNALLAEVDRTVKWDENLRAEYPAINETGTFTASYYGRNINLLSAISIGVYYSNASNISGAYYWNDVDYNVNNEHTASTKTGYTNDERMSNNYIKVNITNIYAYNIYDVYYLRAYNDSGELSDTIGTSVSAYLTQFMDKYANTDTELAKASVALAQAMMVYGHDAASIFK